MTDATGPAASGRVQSFPRLRAYDLATGARLVAGADEAGRAALAGPLVAAACMFDWKSLSAADLERLAWLDDSKEVTKARRRTLRPAILELAVSVAVCVVPPDEIDRDGVDESNLRALREAVSQLEPAPEVCFTDWFAVPDCRHETTRLEGGDATSAAVAAASVIAKTTRDELMVAIAPKYAEYGFDSNKGYNAKVHRDAIRRHGLTPHHRTSLKAKIYREIPRRPGA